MSPSAATPSATVPDGPLPRATLVLGGARSGMSRFAEGLVETHAGPRVYLATAEAGEIRALGEQWSPEADEAIRAHAAVAVPNRFGRHEYDLADFSLTRGAIDERFAHYRERFADHF